VATVGAEGRNLHTVFGRIFLAVDGDGRRLAQEQEGCLTEEARGGLDKN